nr:E3 ubiquitin-protein ligase RNF183 [Nothobranchius furzeri]XP_015805167.2 E3 ubiquitin-protein ligase RNF183 [Nothobranchius furzeri]
MSSYGEGNGDEGNQEPRLPQNVKPKPYQNDQNCKEDQNRKEDLMKKDKPQKARRSRSTDSERSSRGRRREREWRHWERPQRGRSEEPRRRDRMEGDRKQDQPDEDVVEDTECNVCFCSYDNVFKTPKLLACGHTFCLECLARINVTSQEIKSLTCPMCREVTELPHGRDLPRLGNNQDIISRLPAEMQRALSIRFKRSKGKLMLKHPTQKSKTTSVSFSKKNPDAPPIPAMGDLSVVEQGITPANMVDVGRPPNRMHGRMRRLFRSDQCYYAVVASIITITVALMLVGILAFVIIPTIPNQTPKNHTTFPPHYGLDNGGDEP